MKKNPDDSMYRKFSIKDLIVVILCIVALLALVYVVKQSNERAQQQQQHLNELSENIDPTDVVYHENEVVGVLVINEVNRSGWVELYNSGTKSIDLSDYYVLLNGKEVGRAEAGLTVEAKGYFVLELSENPGSREDTVALYDSKHQVVDMLMLPKLGTGKSYACVEDGGIEKGILNATKGSGNENAEATKVTELTFSVPGGFYDKEFLLELSAPKGETIYYTLDGSDPTTEAEKYTTPIAIRNMSGSDVQYAAAETTVKTYVPKSITKGMIVRAIAVDDNGNVSEIETQSYFIGLKNASDFVNMPVISIVTQPENLFDYFDGIYVKGRAYENAIAMGTGTAQAANYLNGWTRPVHIEYFEPEKYKTFEGDMNISIYNDYSVNSTQKSFTMTAEGMQIGDGSSLQQFYSNDNQILLQTNRRDNNYKVREYLAAALLKDSAVGVSELSPCIVFVDGEYWGGYMLCQDYDEEMIAEKYQVQENKIALIRDGRTSDFDLQVQFNEFYNFVANSDMSNEQNYNTVKEQMDIQSYLDYFCANIYLANVDFGLEGWSVWKTTEVSEAAYSDGRWRFMLPKLDNCMANGMTGYGTTATIDTYLQAGVAMNPFFRSLLRNDEFKAQLKSTMEKMAEDTFSLENVQEVLEPLAQKMKKLSTNSYKRFVGNPSDNFFNNEVEKIEEFFEIRAAYILLYTDEVIDGKLDIFVLEQNEEIYDTEINDVEINDADIDNADIDNAEE